MWIVDRPRNPALFMIRIFIDLFMICSAWILSYYIRFYSGLPIAHGTPDPFLYFKLIPFIMVIWLAVFYFTGFYKRTGNHYSPFVEGLDVIQSSIIGVIAFISFTYFYEEYRYSRITVAIFGVLHPLMIIFGRSVIRKCYRVYTRTSPKREVLIIGGGDGLRHAVNLIASTFENSHIYGVILVEGSEEDSRFCSEMNLEILEKGSDWPTFFTNNPTQSVFFALTHQSYSYLEENLDQIVDQVPDIRLVPDILKYTRFSAGIDLVHGVPVINIHESPLVGVGSLIKRVMDIFGAIVALILFGPIMVVIALMIPFSSRGPIFYRQERMGLDGRNFQCLKFRSMPIDAEKETGAVWAKKGDDRATLLGKILRRTSLDELPQIFNVLKGDMSLVGPRPERPVFVNQFRKHIPGYMLRHKVKAGMTGWAQVNGWRGNTSIEKRIEFDLYYIQNWSFWFDLKIILMTIEEVLFSKQAY